MPRSKWKRPLLLFVAVYLTAMVVMVPARWLQQVFAVGAPSIGGVEGTIWQGEVVQLDLPLVLKRLAWGWSPQALLWGRLGYRLELDGPANGAEVQLTASRQLYIEDLWLDGRLSDWFSRFYGAPLPLDLKLAAQVQQAAFNQQGCVYIKEATVQLQGWGGLMAAPLNRLGVLELELGCDEGVLTAQINSSNGLQGQARLQRDRQYHVQLRVSQPDSDLRSDLEVLGFQHVGDVMTLQRQGRL